MSTKPDADELRIRRLLVKNGVGPDATPPPAARPAARKRDWLDDILDQPTAPAQKPKPAPAPAETAPKPSAARPKKPKKRRRKPPPGAPRTAWDTQRPSPRQSLLDAWDRTPYRLKWLALHTTAAAAGWRIGLVTWSTNTAAWYAGGHWTSSSAWVLYALGICAIALYRRARIWAWPVRLIASAPISSAAVGILLYGTGYHH